MNWVNNRTTWCYWTVAVALTLGLQGCATTQPPEGDTATSETQEKEDALRTEFTSAVVTMNRGDTESAKRQFSALHGDNPDRTGPLANLGILAMRAGDTQTAQAHFEATLALDPSHAVSLNHLGVIARQNGRFEQAENYYRTAMGVDAGHLPAMLNLAILLDIYLGRPGEAVPLYERYQSLVNEPHPRLEDWVFDAKNRQ